MKVLGRSALLALLLASAGISLIIYKHRVLGFPLFSGETRQVWKIEARVDFDATGGEAVVYLNLPDPLPGRNTVFASETSRGFDFKVIDRDGDLFAVWRREDAPSGRQSLYHRSEIYFHDTPRPSAEYPPESRPRAYEGGEANAFERAAHAVAEPGLGERALVLKVLREVNRPGGGHLRSLLRERGKRSQKVLLAADLLAAQGMPAAMVRGIPLEERGGGSRSVRHLLKAWYANQWHLFDPREVILVPWDRFVEYQQGDQPLFEVHGGENSRLRFSLLREDRASLATVVENAHNNRNVLVDFSIYSLPVQQQSAFKLLLLIPLGAVVVVILRTLVGIRTSGTFMPILIALSFLQTGLGAGLMLFLLVVGTGLLIRGLMTRLNLLLVPRLAAVLVFVIIIYGAIGIAGHKLGFEWGMHVIYFPLIILAWTIERMSVLWDEEGAREVMIQGGGSLLTASLAYLLMSQRAVADSIFIYPESLFVLLAIIVAIGSYSGYRLSDLRRFEPMERY